MKDLKNKFKDESKGAKTPSSFIDYVDLEKCKTHKLEKLSLEKGKDYLLGILPFVGKTDKCLVRNHPKKIYNEKGEQTYHILIYAHSFLKFTNGSYICMKETYGKKCAICDYYDKLKSEGYEYDDIKHLRSKLRALYLIKDENDKIKVLDVANTLFEEKWQAIVEKRGNRGDDFFPVYVKEDWGRYLDFTCKDKGKGFYELDAFDFPEIKDFDKEIANHGISLDELLVFPDNEHIQQLIDNIGEVEEDNKSEDEEVETKENEYDDYIEDVKEKKEPEKKEKKEKKQKKEDCPYDLKFGIDWDEYRDCDNCEQNHEDIYEKCKKLSKEG